MQKVFFPPRCVSRLRKVRTNKIREIEPNSGEFLLSNLRDDEASDRVAYLSSGRHLPLSLVFVFADSLSRAFSLAETIVSFGEESAGRCPFRFGLAICKSRDPLEERVRKRRDQP